MAKKKTPTHKDDEELICLDGETGFGISSSCSLYSVFQTKPISLEEIPSGPFWLWRFGCKRLCVCQTLCGAEAAFVSYILRYWMDDFVKKEDTEEEAG